MDRTCLVRGIAHRDSKILFLKFPGITAGRGPHSVAYIPNSLPNIRAKSVAYTLKLRTCFHIFSREKEDVGGFPLVIDQSEKITESGHINILRGPKRTQAVVFHLYGIYLTLKGKEAHDFVKNKMSFWEGDRYLLLML